MTQSLLEMTVGRRTGLIQGAKLAFAAPAVIAALRSGVAHANSGSGEHDVQTNDAQDVSSASATNTHTATGNSTRVEVAGLQTQCSGAIKPANLVSSNSKDKRDRDRHGEDSIQRGAIHIFGDNGVATKCFVRMKQTQANAVYRVVVLSDSIQNNQVELARCQVDHAGDFRAVLPIRNVVLPINNGRLKGQCVLQRQVGSNTFATQFVMVPFKV